MEQKIFIRRTEDEVLQELREEPRAYRMYLSWNDALKERFMAFCMGKKTLPVLYDTVFKMLMHPDLHPERLEDCVSCLLKKKVKFKAVLPVEDILMDGETTMVMDILVELEDGALVLVEIQKVPYYFPAERASCYSADLLLRQYSRVKNKKGKEFNYNDLQKVYTIVFYERSTDEFKSTGETFIHHAHTVCDSGLSLNFLQEYYLIALDVFQKSEYAKHKDSDDHLAGWLSFFCTENTEDAEALCEIYPWLSDLYVEMARFELSKELIGMFSEMLREMDRNTIRYMVDDMNQKIENGKVELAGLKETYAQTKAELAETEDELTEVKGKLTEVKGKLTEVKGKLTEAKDELAEAKDELAEVKDELAEAKDELAEAKDELAEAKDELAEKDVALLAKDEEIARLKTLLANK